MEERLQKILARAGIASRRKAEELILQGRVLVNRQVVRQLGTKADPERDRIELDGEVITPNGPRVYILLNKPKGYISAVSDPLGRPVVSELVKGVKLKVFPVGRLDYDAEGVLLMTNDGVLTNKLIHPRYGIPKTYLVKVRGVPDEKDLARLRDGVYLEDGKTLPARVKLIRTMGKNPWVSLTITEGRNRQVKRMCQAIGHPVMKLKRVEFAGIKLGDLRPGDFRMLTRNEVERLVARINYE